MCQCTHIGATAIRATALVTLRQLLQKLQTDTALRLLITHGIESWLDRDTEVLHVCPPDDHPFAAQLKAATLEQNALEWNQVCQGRLSTAWGDCYQSWGALTATQGTTHQFDAIKWTSSIAKWGFQLTLNLWDHCNTIVHSANSQSSHGLHSRLSVLLAASHSRYFVAVDLDILLRLWFDGSHLCKNLVILMC